MGLHSGNPVPSSSPGSSGVEIHGENTTLGEAAPWRKGLATLTDALALGTVSTGLLYALLGDELPHKSHLVTAAFFCALGAKFGSRYLPATLGTFIWGLFKENQSDRGMTLKLKHRTKPGILLIQSLATLWTGAVFIVTAQTTFFTSPLLRKADLWDVPRFEPSPQDVRFAHLPMYFSAGAWPKIFGDQPVFYEIPYEKGPPKKFIGKIIARWSAPEITLTIEGPRTRTDADVSTVFRCLLDPFDSISATWKCPRIREENLAPHMKEMLRPGLLSWSLKLFEVNNPQLPTVEVPRGIFLSATYSNQTTEERFILLNTAGAQQTLVLKRPMDASGEEAKNLALQTLGSLRVFSELGPGRGLANERLLETELTDLQGEEDPIRFGMKIASLQSVLISKLSVDPKSFDAYYHLAGTALMLFKFSDNLRTRKTQVLSGPLAMMLQEWVAVSRPLIQSSYQYGMDVGAEPDKIKRLERVWSESSSN